MPPSRMLSTRVLAASLAAPALAALVFLVWPGLDLSVAGLFVGPGDAFVGSDAWGRAARPVFEAVPILVMAGCAVLYGVRRWAGAAVWAPNGPGLAMLALSLALGPGLLVNTVLKDHAHRPRPVQVSAFGGPDPFRPFWRFDGACARNCSFVSGEGASASWTAAAALLCPPPYRAAALAASIAFAAAASLLRMASGGHFLSDCCFAAALTWLVILGCWRAVAAITGREPAAGTENRHT